MKVTTKKKIGSRLAIEHFANLDSFVIPAGSKVTSIVVQKADSTAGNLKLGTLVPSSGGNHEIQTLTITAEPTAAGDLTITLDDKAVTIAVVNTDTIPQVCAKIAAGTYVGWTATVSGNDSVVFDADAVGAHTGDFTFGAAETGVTGTFKKTLAGVNAVTASVGEQVVANVALPVDGKSKELTLVKSVFDADTVVSIGVSTAATGTLHIGLEKLF